MAEGAPAGNAAAASLSPRAAAAWLGVLLFACHAYFMPAPASNELSRFALVRAIVERGRLDIDPDAETTADVARFAGHSFSDKAPGAALLAVPAYFVYLRGVELAGASRPAVARESSLRVLPPGAEDRLLHNDSFRRAIYFCNLATNALAGALLGALFFAWLGRCGLPPRRALLLTAALSGGSLILPYSTAFFGHVLAAAGLFAAWWWNETERPARAGLCAGLGVLCELPAALGAGVLLAALLARATGGRARVAAWFAVGALGPLVVLGAYQTAAFGRPWATGYAHVADPTFAAGMAQGLLGVGWPRPGALAAMFFGRARGLFYLAPVLLLGMWGLGRGLAQPQSRGRAGVAAAIVLGFALLSAGYYMWWGGAAVGPRHFVPALPFLALGLVWLPLDEAGSRWLRPLYVGLLAVSLANVLAATAVSPLAPPDVDLVFGYTWTHVARGEVPLYPGSTNFGRLLGLRGVASLVPLLVLVGVGGSLLVRRLEAPARGSA